MSMTPLQELRHSSSHVLATAVLRLFPEAKLDIGPPTDTGFYYDIDLDHKLTADDLTRIEGIGPKIAELLHAAGVNTFAALASTKVERLQAILHEAGSHFSNHDPATWPQQSALAAAGKWDEMKKLQDELNGGRAA